VLVRSAAGLLAAVGVDDDAALSEAVDEATELDAWVVLDDTGVEIRCGDVGTPVPFPLLIAEFWQAVEETEADEVRRWGPGAG
jgi:hypothetical protein